MSNNYDISVALQNLRTSETKLQELATSLGNIGQSITVITGKIDPFWEGETKEAYEVYLVELINHVKKIESSIVQRKTELSSALSLYETTEQRTQSSVEALSINNIF